MKKILLSEEFGCACSYCDIIIIIKICKLKVEPTINIRFLRNELKYLYTKSTNTPTYPNKFDFIGICGIKKTCAFIRLNNVF